MPNAHCPMAKSTMPNAHCAMPKPTNRCPNPEKSPEIRYPYAQDQRSAEEAVAHRYLVPAKQQIEMPIWVVPSRCALTALAH